MEIDQAEDDYPLWSELILSEPERAGIGSVAIESARLDDMLEATIWALLGLDKDDGLAVTQRLFFVGKLDLVRKLLLRKHPEAGAVFTAKDGLEQRMKRANDERRTIIHGLWRLPDGHDTIRYLRAMLLKDRGGIEPTVTLATRPGASVRAGSVRAIALELRAVREEFADLLVQYEVA